MAFMSLPIYKATNEKTVAQIIAVRICGLILPITIASYQSSENVSKIFDNPWLTGIVSTAKAVNSPSIESRVSGFDVALHIILAAKKSHVMTTGMKMIAISN